MNAKMKDILADIIAHKRVEVEKSKAQTPVEEVLSHTINRHEASMHDALAASDSGIIAEFKRRSPSKGWIHPDARIQEIAPL